MNGANQSRGDSVSLIPSMSPAPAKKTAKKKKKPKPTPNPSSSSPYDFVWSTPSISPPPAKKRRTSGTRKKTPTLMSLPIELLLNCVARVSRLYYPSLSLVSKRFRSLLASPELYKVRSLIGHTETCLYVSLRHHSESLWFTLCLKPGKEKEGYVLGKVPIPYSPYSRPPWFSDLVVAGPSIYHIASSFTSLPPSVSILDCCSHTWREAPSMRVGLISFTPSVLDQKIYVAGHGKDGVNCIEVFDTKAENWDDDPEPIPCRDGHYYKTISIGGKLHVVHSPPKHNDVGVYNSKEGRWDMVEWRSLAFHLGSDTYCEIDNVVYSVDNRVIRWSDTEVRFWRRLKGLVGLPEFPDQSVRTRVRLANYGGKMAVFWTIKSPNYRYNTTLMIWCALITLERRHESCEIWGKVDWCGHVLTSYADLVKVLAVTL